MLTRRTMLMASAALLTAGLNSSGAFAQEVLQVGAILPLTGPAAEVGNDERRGLEFAVKVANETNLIPGYQIELHVEDNQAKADLSVVAFNKLVSLYEVPVIMTGYSGPSLAMAPLADRRKVIVVNAGAQSDKLADAGHYLLNTVPLAGTEISRMAQYLREELKAETAAVIYVKDAQGEAGLEAFERNFTEMGGKVLGSESVPFGETNFRGPLSKVAALDPDVLFVVQSNGFVQLAEQREQMGFDVIMAGMTSVNQASIIASDAAQGWYHTQLRFDPPADVAAAYKAETGTDMTFYSGQYYNSMYVLLQSAKAAVEAGQAPSGENMRNQIDEKKTFEGLAGPVTFEGNTASMPIDIRVLKDKQTQFVKTY